jgi:serine/threonine-protein kinase
MPSSDDIGALPAGTVLHDRYRVEAVLGAGAFGITYRATDTVLGRSVAIKELYPEEYRLTREGTEVSVPSAKNAQHQRLIERVIKQGLLHRKLDHPHLMDVYEAFKAHNTAYLVAEYLAGASLRARLSEAGRLPGAEVRRLIEQVGGGLAHLHARDALHLDVKPANVMYAAGEYVLIDYGAGRMSTHENSIELSTGGFTPAYAAIEQTDGSMKKGPYTDLYALGVTAYECLTGRRPPTSVARLMSGGSLVWTGEPAVGLQPALEAALQVKPEDRPTTVETWFDEYSIGHSSSDSDLPSTWDVTSTLSSNDPTPLDPSQFGLPDDEPSDIFSSHIDSSAFLPYIEAGYTIEGDSNWPTALQDALRAPESTTSLDLRDCGLTELPGSISRLKRLKRLWLCDNDLAYLPNQIGQLSRLEDLRVNNNLLVGIPSSIGQLHNLRALIIRDNLLSDLPDSIASLDNVESLSIEGNKFKRIPSYVKNMPSLVLLNLKNNPVPIRRIRQLQRQRPDLWVEF